MRQAKKPETKERQNASTPPSKWTCPRERTPATANTSCRPAAPLQEPTRRVSKATNGVTPGPLHSRRRVVQGIQPLTLRHREYPRAALPSPPRPQRCPNSPTKAPRPGHPAHGTKHEADPGAQKQKYAQNCNFCFCETDRRNGAILAKDACVFNANQAEQQHGTTGHRPCKHSCPHPWQKSRASSTEKCNI